MGPSKHLDWEPIKGFPINRSGSRPVGLYRAAVPGGWLVGLSDWIGDGGMGGLTFVPDPHHTWDGGSVERG